MNQCPPAPLYLCAVFVRNIRAYPSAQSSQILLTLTTNINLRLVLQVPTRDQRTMRDGTVGCQAYQQIMIILDGRLIRRGGQGILTRCEGDANVGGKRERR